MAYVESRWRYLPDNSSAPVSAPASSVLDHEKESRSRRRPSTRSGCRRRRRHTAAALLFAGVLSLSGCLSNSFLGVGIGSWEPNLYLLQTQSEPLLLRRPSLIGLIRQRNKAWRRRGKTIIGGRNGRVVVVLACLT
nr:unnamed protein product [Digitaria exilis]